ncbi:hypothetical protein L7F22_047675 [Adiantum nelumboides]|nr:hypothetical protein [Adiantum nelumboides]
MDVAKLLIQTERGRVRSSLVRVEICYSRALKVVHGVTGQASAEELEELSEQAEELVAEVDYLGELHHSNLVNLIGYCSEGEHRLLVYEFMEKGSLEQHLFRRATPLPWTTRMKIALGAAKGLAFLHGRDPPIIFRDFKTSNILLDNDYTAKLSDFGLARDGPQGDKSHVSTRVMGTYGYAAPEYVMTGHLTARSDIYSFGVVLLELLTGRRSMDKSRPSGQHNLVEWARPFLGDKKKVIWVVDPNLNGIYSPKGVTKASGLAARCLARDPRARPSMQQVLDVLALLQNPTDMASPVISSSAPSKDAKSQIRNPQIMQGQQHIVGNGQVRGSHLGPNRQVVKKIEGR